MLQVTEAYDLLATDIMLVDNCVRCYIPRTTRMSTNTTYTASAFSFENLGEPDLFVKILASSVTGEAISVYIELPAFHFLPHLLNGATLTLTDRSGREWTVQSADEVLEDLRDHLLAKAVQPDSTGDSYQRILWHLNQLRSSAVWWSWEYDFCMHQGAVH